MRHQSGRAVSTLLSRESDGTPLPLLRWVLAGLSAALFASGLVVRLTVRDRYDALAPVFYATPWPVLAFLAAVVGACAVAWATRRFLVATSFVLVVAGCLVCWIEESWYQNVPLSIAPDFRVAFWNAEHPKRRLPEVIETVKGFDGDIIGIVETESTDPADVERWRAAFPGYWMQTLPGHMLFLTRGKVLAREHGDLDGAGRYNLVKLRIAQRIIYVLFVDLNAAPHRSRRPAFARISEILNAHRGAEVIMMGDFNTPRDSVYFSEIRASMDHAFEVAGQGMSETWPVPVPVLSLDHIWATRGIQVTRCTQDWALSDHRPVVAEISTVPRSRVGSGRERDISSSHVYQAD